jgi:long-subunit acyl-CoA synthetase (AMP-forming)
MLSVDGYKKFTAIIDERLKHKKTLFKSMLKHKVAIINKKLNTNFVLNEEYDLNSLLSNNIITQDIIISDKDKPADGLEVVGKIKTLLKTIGEVDTTPLCPVPETVEMLEKNIKKEVDAKLGTMTPEEINEFTTRNLE